MNELEDRRAVVRAALTQLEDKHDAEVVSAWAIGARARGTAHEGSDIDVFAIAVNRPGNLLTERTKLYREFDVFENHGPGVDVQLWSLEAVYDGILDDNPTVVHAFDSEEVLYLGDTSGFWDLQRYALQHINTYQLLHHYRSLAKDNYSKYITNGNDPTVGRLFFITDALLRAWYIEETGNLPPYNAEELSDEITTIANTVDSELEENNYLGYNALIQKKQKGRTDQDLYEEWSDDEIEQIERELGRSPREYDKSVYGAGVNPKSASSMLRRIAEGVWSFDHRGGL